MMNVTEMKQKKLKASDDRTEEVFETRYNSSGKLKKPVLFKKTRSEFSFVVDWQLNDFDEMLLE